MEIFGLVWVCIVGGRSGGRLDDSICEECRRIVNDDGKMLKSRCQCE